MLSLARTLEFAGKGDEALEVYTQFVKEIPDYPDVAGIYRKMSPLAQQYGSAEQKNSCSVSCRPWLR